MARRGELQGSDGITWLGRGGKGGFWVRALGCRSFLRKSALDLESTLGFRGAARGASGPPPLPLHLPGLSWVVGEKN